MSSETKYCPYCNWELVNNICPQTYICGYKGPGISKKERTDYCRGYKLGDITGDRNNGSGHIRDYDDD
jgi:hypothetical protein